MDGGLKEDLKQVVSQIVTFIIVKFERNQVWSYDKNLIFIKTALNNVLVN